MSVEDGKMLEIIHENCKNQRIFNQKRDKRIKRERILNNILMFLGSSVFMIGLMLLINIIENAKF